MILVLQSLEYLEIVCAMNYSFSMLIRISLSFNWRTKQNDFYEDDGASDKWKEIKSRNNVWWSNSNSNRQF